MGLYIGIDPGVSGGIAAIDDNGEVLIAVKMPESERDVLDALRGAQELEPTAQAIAVLERVSSSPQMGVVSAFTFGKGYGALRMALISEDIRFDEISPRRWQAGVGVIQPKQSTGVMGKRDTTAAKNATKLRAQELFPRQKITHAIADALLIAEFCRRSKGSTGAIEDASKPKRAKMGHTELF